jgi:spore maturation protein CgeB
MKIVVLGLSITSSWGNGHATTYRGLVRELARRGHEVLFLERDQPWYAENRDLPRPPFGETHLYTSLPELRNRFGRQVRAADLVIVGSFVPEGVAAGNWVVDEANGLTAFYDIDTPVTLAKLADGDCSYLSPELIPRYQLYLSFTGGPTLARIESLYCAPMARPLYCAVDPDLYYPEPFTAKKWKLGYLGTYSDDRQPALERLLLAPARLDPADEMVVAGSLYPEPVQWPDNVERIAHLSPADHRAFYNAQDFTLNITRAEMIRAGYSPSVRLFEAAACGTPIVSDAWPGLETFFTPGEEILLAESTAEMLAILREVPATTALALGRRARERVLAHHTAAHRAAELEALIIKASSPARRAEHTLEYSPTL